jgi:hypothetical protein
LLCTSRPFFFIESGIQSRSIETIAVGLNCGADGSEFPAERDRLLEFAYVRSTSYMYLKGIRSFWVDRDLVQLPEDLTEDLGITCIAPVTLARWKSHIAGLYDL